MRTPGLRTDRLELRPLPVRAAEALPGDRAEAGRVLGATLLSDWPDPNLVGILPRHVGAPAGMERFGIWVMVERDGGHVVGDIGFHGPPDDSGTVEIGYSVAPSRRGRGYAAEAAGALAAWALSQPAVRTVVAGCDPANVPSVRTLERVGFERTGHAGGELRWRYRPRHFGA